MKRVIVSPYSRGMRNGKENPKNYPWWEEVISGLREKDIHVIQAGVAGEKPLNADSAAFNLSLSDLSELIKSCDTFASVDNFFHHLCYLLEKPGVVIFGQSDPNIFGHALHDNLLKDRKYLRPNQFNFWEDTEHNKECFVEPPEVIDKILRRVLDGN